jgi:hypothetical protein
MLSPQPLNIPQVLGNPFPKHSSLQALLAARLYIGEDPRSANLIHCGWQHKSVDIYRRTLVTAQTFSVAPRLLAPVVILCYCEQLPGPLRDSDYLFVGAEGLEWNVIHLLEPPSRHRLWYTVHVTSKVPYVTAVPKGTIVGELRPIKHTWSACEHCGDWLAGF